MSSMILAIDTARAAIAERRRELLEAERFQDAPLDPAHCAPSAAAATGSAESGE